MTINIDKSHNILSIYIYIRCVYFTYFFHIMRVYKLLWVGGGVDTKLIQPFKAPVKWFFRKLPLWKQGLKTRTAEQRRVAGGAAGKRWAAWWLNNWHITKMFSISIIQPDHNMIWKTPWNLKSWVQQENNEYRTWIKIGIMWELVSTRYISTRICKDIMKLTRISSQFPVLILAETIIF